VQSLALTALLRRCGSARRGPCERSINTSIRVVGEVTEILDRLIAPWRLDVGRLRRHALVFGASLALAATQVIASPNIALGRTDDATKPTLFIHGGAGSSAPCDDDFGQLLQELHDNGWTGNFYMVKYMSSETNCSAIPGAPGQVVNSSLFGFGHHNVWDFAPNDSLSTHDGDTSLEHLSFHLAWYIWYLFTSREVAVDVVGHSLGGLMIRYALEQVALHNSLFPQYLMVEDVVTLGTPHAGQAWLSSFNYELQETNSPSTPFMAWLNANAQNPQGTNGTDWTVIGSHYNGGNPAWDLLVDALSAVAMNVPHRWRYYLEDIAHSQYMHVDDPGYSKRAYKWDGSAWTSPVYTYAPVEMIRMATYYGAW
jgi:hypothetical protein